MPKETGMMFKGPLVRAILEGRKTQTRRIVAMPRKRDNFVMLDHGNGWWPYQSGDGESELCDDGNEHPYSAPYGNKGDLIYVRETWMDLTGTGVEHRPDPRGPLQRYAYAADTPPGSYGDAARKDYGLKWKPSIHMPKAAARIWLEITGVCLERLQSITAEDCITEGLSTTLREHDAEVHLQQQFKELWDSTTDRPALPANKNSNRYARVKHWLDTHPDTTGWAANPWVWVYEFKRIEHTATA